MKLIDSEVKKIHSAVEYNYITLRITRSRLEKGLLAIPVALMDKFPKKKQQIKVAFDNSMDFKNLNFTPSQSSTRECRIGGMRNWFDQNILKEGDEIVIQIINPDKYYYRIIREKDFVAKIREYQSELDTSDTEREVDQKLIELSEITRLSMNDVLISEFIRLARQKVNLRNYTQRKPTKIKEKVPISLKKILGKIYGGRCQLTNFTFIQKNGNPYFEIHHIDENRGNFIKNLLVVSPNIHAQFTYARKEEFFDDEGWLIRVRFNEIEYSVNQFIRKVKDREFYKLSHE